MRGHRCSGEDFRNHLHQITTLLAFEALKELETKNVRVRTPLASASGRILKQPTAIIAILRAGLGMVEPIHRLIPQASIGHIGLYRDHKTLRPIQYYEKLPPAISECFVILVDPMLATGYSAAKAVRILRERGVKKCVMLSLISALEGIAVMQKNHPEVKIFTASVDRKLNSRGYIIPGLGDAGDRLYGTE